LLYTTALLLEDLKAIVTGQVKGGESW
jgi:hypothetical protein